MANPRAHSRSPAAAATAALVLALAAAEGGCRADNPAWDGLAAGGAVGTGGTGPGAGNGGAGGSGVGANGGGDGGGDSLPPPRPEELAQWDFDESGPILFDQGANHNDGKLVGSPIPVRVFDDAAGRFSVLVFDGASGWGEIPPSKSLDSVADAFSVSSWVYLESIDSEWRGAVSRGPSGGGGPDYALGVQNGVPYFWGRIGQSGGASQLPLGRWVMLCGVYDGFESHLYVDGVEVGRSPRFGVRLAPSTEPLVIGAAQRSATGVASMRWKGRLDDVRLFLGALAGCGR